MILTEFLVGGGLLTIAGAGMGFWFGKLDKAQKAEAAASLLWPSTLGTVVATEVQVKRSGHGKSRSTHYVPLIAYHYEAGGGQRQGTRIRFGMLGYSLKSNADKVLLPYKVGNPVTVRYNPANAADSVLEAGVSTGNLRFGFFAGWGCAGLGVLLVMVGLFSGS